MHTYIADPDTARSFALMGASAVPVATAEDTAQAWEAFELRLGPTARSPRHTLTADKLFYVADGVVTIELGDRSVAAAPGAFVHVPAGPAHCYRNDSGAAARLLVVVTGGGQIDFLRGMSALTAGGPPDPAALAEHTARHGVTILPAP